MSFHITSNSNTLNGPLAVYLLIYYECDYLGNYAVGLLVKLGGWAPKPRLQLIRWFCRYCYTGFMTSLFVISIHVGAY